ncbi:uncharacterized protein LOC136088567 [Hydra vulgaris]|uniref:Uncharacterized protein LOC136088567 n=1 Tax=Hydra vulgaris TaxID=6087 RepID=A0ABM4D2T7_HYDVU
MELESNFLYRVNWPSFGQGNHSPASKLLHEWCGKISKYVLELSNKIKNLEDKEKNYLKIIDGLKDDLCKSKQNVNSANITNEWVQIVTKGSKSGKKPPEQLVVANATINELHDREKRKRNLIVFGIPESTQTDFLNKRNEDEKKIADVFDFIGKADIKPVYTRRLRSKDKTKPGPILVELNEPSIRNPVLLAAKKLRNSIDHKQIYISPDLTEAERQLDLHLRQERNRLNANLETNSTFRYGICGNQLKKFKKNQKCT